MDAYVIGFVGLMVFMVLIGIVAVVFVSLDGKMSASGDTRIRYTDVHQVNTHTIETVDTAGKVETWERSA